MEDYTTHLCDLQYREFPLTMHSLQRQLQQLNILCHSLLRKNHLIATEDLLSLFTAGCLHHHTAEVVVVHCRTYYGSCVLFLR